tara:strand:- start:18501 stop:19337 length:837 start_codon:yes stop_codon:yes gene_type:complete
MINYNGNFTDKFSIHFNNRGFLFGDSVFETIKVVNNNLLFWEEHYLRLMSSMRILRIRIPNLYTPEFLENEIKKTNLNFNKSFSGRVRLTIFRDGKGLYLPESNEPVFLINSKETKETSFNINSGNYKVDIYKEYFIQSNLLSNIKSNNRLINVLGSIYAKENELDNCIILNDQKNVAEFLNGNIFIVKDKKVTTPPVSSGCLDGVMRKKIIESLKQSQILSFEEKNISPFELISSDEIWISNSISGIIPVTEYRKKRFSKMFAQTIVEYFNKKILES